MRFPLVFLACVLALHGPSTPTIVVLEEDITPLVEHVNSRSDQRRFLAILSPT